MAIAGRSLAGAALDAWWGDERDDSVCDPVVDGAVLPYDTNHLTATRAESLAPVLTEYLREILGSAGE